MRPRHYIQSDLQSYTVDTATGNNAGLSVLLKETSTRAEIEPPTPWLKDRPANHWPRVTLDTPSLFIYYFLIHIDQHDCKCASERQNVQLSSSSSLFIIKSDRICESLFHVVENLHLTINVWFHIHWRHRRLLCLAEQSVRAWRRARWGAADHDRPLPRAAQVLIAPTQP